MSEEEVNEKSQDELSEDENQDAPRGERSEASADGQPELLFSVVRGGEREVRGPYTEKDLLNLLNSGEITQDDLVYFDGMERWQPIREVFEIHEQINHFVDDGQDKHKVGQAFREVSNVVGEGEDIYYIAVQERAGLLSKSKQCVAVTNRHIFLLRALKGGFELVAHPWDKVSNTMMRDEGKDLGTFSILLDMEKRVDIGHIPLKQVKRLFQLSQEMRRAVEEAA